MLETLIQASQNTTTKVPRSVSYWIKISALGIIPILMSYAVGSYIRFYFEKSGGVIGTHIGGFVTTLVIFLVSLFLAGLCIEKKWILSVIAAAVSILCVGQFYTAGAYQWLIMMGIFLIIVLFGFLTARREMETALKIRFVRVFNAITSRTIFGLSLIAALAIFGASTTKPLDANNILFPRSLFEVSGPMISKILQPILGTDVDISLTLEQFAVKGVEDAVEKSTDLRLKRGMTPEIKAQLVETFIGQFQKTIETSLGVSIQKKQKLGTAIYDGLLKKFNGLDANTKKSIVLFFSVLFVIAIQTLSLIARIVLIPIAFVIYEILVLCKFVTTTFQNEYKERLNL